MNLILASGLFLLTLSVVSLDAQPTTQPTTNPNLPTLWLIGDSTVRNGRDTGNNGQWGWGNPIRHFFDETRLNVTNKAMGGTSSRTFYRDLWPEILGQMKEGDFLIMQFGHNDAGPLDDDKRARGTIRGNGDETREIDNPITKKREVVHSYGWYLRQFVAEAKAKGVKQVIVCSPIPRNSWKDGKVNRNTSYSPAAKAAAEQAGVFFIDLNELVAQKYDSEGEQQVTDTYFPEKEVVHPDWAGAVLNAQCVVDGIRSFKDCELSSLLKPKPPTDLKNPTGKPR
jgi:lysophospholipase L1-like esterase